MPQTRQTSLDPMDPSATPSPPGTRTPRTVGASIGKSSVYTKTLLGLYDDNKREILGNSYTFIQTQGLLNIPRLKALALESPTGITGVIGSTVGTLIGAGAVGRPTDTIFRNYKPFSRTLSLTAPTTTLLQEAVKPGEDYYVKRSPSPSLIGSVDRLKNTFTNKNVAQSTAISALNKYGSKTGVQNFMNRLKNQTPTNTKYGPLFMPTEKGYININNADYLYSTHFKNAAGEMESRSNRNKNSEVRQKQLDNEGLLGYESNWEVQSDIINKALFDENETDKTIQQFIKDDQWKMNIPYVLFKVYGDSDISNRSVLLPATVTNLSEQFTPAINSFKYVGSPFNLYRYSGVERVLNFDMKLYYTDDDSKMAMIKKLNLLREYTFPDRKLTAISYPGTEEYSPIVFNPNILQLTINGLYKDLYCIIDTMTFTIEDTIPWATKVNINGAVSDETKPYPTVIEVTFSLKIIEHLSVSATQNKEGKITYADYIYEKSETKNNEYTNYFTGYNERMKSPQRAPSLPPQFIQGDPSTNIQGE